MAARRADHNLACRSRLGRQLCGFPVDSFTLTLTLAHEGTAYPHYPKLGERTHLGNVDWGDETVRLSGEGPLRNPVASPVDPSVRALSGRLKFIVRRHKFKKDSISWVGCHTWTIHRPYGRQSVGTCRGTLLVRNRFPLGTYSRTMSGAVWCSWWGGRFLMSEVPLYRCQANMAHVRQSRPDSGLGFQVNAVTPFQVVAFSVFFFFITLKSRVE